MLTSLLLVLVFRTAVLSSPSNPINVTFASENLRNILQWSAGGGALADTKYSVRYAIYGDSLGLEKRVHWRPVPHCTEISRTWCDLSVETSDLEHGYFARVRAVSRKGNSKWVEAPMRFDPIHETDFGPPHVSVEVNDKYVIVNMEGPMRYPLHNHTPQVSMATLFPHMTYNLSIYNTRSGIIRHFTLKSNKFKYLILDRGAEYCFSAATKLEDRLMPSKHRASAWHCIATPEDRLTDRLEKILLISITVPVVLLCLLVAGGCVLHKYLSGVDQKSPYILNQPTFLPPPLMTTCDNVNIIVMSLTEDEVPINKFYPKLPNSPVQNPEDSYKKREWQIEAGPSTSQTSSLQTSSSTPMLFNKCGENQQDLRNVQDDSDTETSPLQFNPNESLDVIEGANIMSSMDYASQNARPIQPSNQSDDLPDDYGFVKAAGEEEPGVLGSPEQEDEDVAFLQLDWSPTSRSLLIPGLDLGIGPSEGGGGGGGGGDGGGGGGRPNLETVFVRQPSEEDALLGAGWSSDQWDPEGFMAKWDLVVSDDVT